MHQSFVKQMYIYIILFHQLNFQQLQAVRGGDKRCLEKVPNTDNSVILIASLYSNLSSGYCPPSFELLGSVKSKIAYFVSSCSSVGVLRGIFSSDGTTLGGLVSDEIAQ